jgi:dCTP deaminase
VLLPKGVFISLVFGCFNMILTKAEILKEIKQSRLVIEPFNEAALQSCAYDLGLSDELRIFNKNSKPVDLTEAIDWTSVADADLTEKISISSGYLLKPGEFVLGISQGRVDMPDNIFGLLSGRTRFARLGLAIDTANFVSPNTSNRQIFEIINLGQLPLKLVPGERIAQIAFLRCEGKSEERGTCRRQHAL